ncbi:MAG TPA: hypothetical protein VG755_18225, partial [Nannocystaceae bacterium]|nr:hypothetical protein [Nannocystaceae bacterium]
MLRGCPFVVALGLFACGSSSAPPAPLPSGEQPKIEKPAVEIPQHDAKMMAVDGDAPVRTVAAQGSMSAALNGTATSFT